MFIGLDLAGTEKGKTGFCFLNRKETTFILHTDKGIIELVREIRPKVIAIDAPLSMPKNDHYRGCDKKVRKAGILIFSFNFYPLKKLAERGIKLKRKIQNKIKKCKIIETYPHAVLKMNKEIAKKVERKKFSNKDEKDAFVCALVARNFSLGTAKCFSGGGKIWY